MSALISIVLLVSSLVMCYGIQMEMKRELFYQGRELFCAQLQCTENIGEDTQISALINMSIYEINEPGTSLPLSSISESDSKIRDFKVPGVFSDGKISKHSGDLNLFLSNETACHEKMFKCEIYFTYKTGSIGFVEEKVAALSKEKVRRSDLMMSLKAKTLNYVKTVDTMADFLKSFEDPGKLKGADMSMSLQMSHTSRDDNTVDKVKSNKEITDNTNQDKTDNDMDTVKKRLNSLTEQMQVIMERFKSSDQLHLNTTEQYTDKKVKYNATLWTKEMCRQGHDSNSPSRQLVQLDESKITLCDTKTDHGGWLLIQRRVLGDVNFTRGWDDYKHGFGSMAGDFWLGNDWISKLTMMGYNELRVDMIIGSTNQFAEYCDFKVDNETAKYKISLSTFRGNASDALIAHNGMKFSTPDSDNDEFEGSCAQTYKAGWWFYGCVASNLNGIYGASSSYGVYWSGEVKSVEMKLRKI
ncbi:angiopoietin-related protein 7-like [Physella acuta]|uniref:angiopoietin-related protein 7-like n=1 Tax=Physella acuta TaxID=109671 RepID=UPI0027DE3AAA|nr:angiopoietin-related protein 7-like [Physella acuta]